MANFIRSDLEFILQQILIAEANAAGRDLTALLPNSQVPFGLRTVDGRFNNLILGQSLLGAADQLFPLFLDQSFRNDLDGDTFDLNGPAPGGELTNTNFATTGPLGGNVVDADPRIISNLVADQTSNNPAAVQAFVEAGLGAISDGTQIDPATGLPFVIGTLLDQNNTPVPAGTLLTVLNTTPDEGLSAPFNTWFTFFGQFFDHGLDLIQKANNGTVFIPLQPDDPLFVPGGTSNFMVLTRADNIAVGAGADGVLNTADDVHRHLNTTSPFVDQNQTYTSHPSHQVFLRAYELNAAGQPEATGKLITNRNLGADGLFGTADDVELGGMSTWAVVKAQARDFLGINLTDADINNIPLLATDLYGNFIRGPNGFPQVVMRGFDDIAGTTDDVLVEGNPAVPISLANAVRTGQAFLVDIAHIANPFDSVTGALKIADADGVVGVDDGIAGTYDNELLDAHFMAGDGRVNENIGLTAVHHVFHSEHNRLVDHTKDVVLASNDLAFLSAWLMPGTAPATFPVTPEEIAALDWNGERLFQAAKFGTEMQYQHLVFEEFARKVQPNVDAFLAPDGFDATIDPAILNEFASVVFRFGHSMLTETIDRLDPNFASSDIGLISAFLNPLAFNQLGGVTVTAEQAAGAIVRGLTRQQGNEIDEFVTEAVRNNLLGLPLDLPAINITRGRDTGVPSLNAARREFYQMTGDNQLKPYASWVEFMGNLKHETSLINFIAAYGTHASIIGATTLVAKRLAAMELVFGTDLNGDGLLAADRLDFLNSTGAWASGANGVTTTGLDAVDFWIGGLAEKQMPFGGLLGSTFNFVFETQLEALQNGDRLYYLARLAGLNFLTEMENNSFAKLVMLNTDARHLPADIFSTPAFILESNPLTQRTGLDEPGPDGVQGTADDVAGVDGLLGNSDPFGGSGLIPLVIRDDPATPVVDTNYLRYTGEDHVVLGGTDLDDTLIASIGDDTLWGDAGNDRLEGGDGVDNIEGGDGNDIITDRGGDDVLKGNAGDDVIHGGNGENLILGGDGSDFIVTGEDISETFGGQGNDFILGAQMNLPTFGNEGDDWIEIGTSDGAAGDNFDPLEASTIPGHDVFITGGGFDEAEGEGGDDIMVMSDGEDHLNGGGGFDWASYDNDLLGVSADLLVNDLIEPPVAPSNQGILDRFAFTEGLTGSPFADVLRGDHADAAEINVPGPLNGGLNAEGIARITGLQDFLNQMLGTDAVPVVTSFASGNIILGGGGSDIMEGRGGDDLLDGERFLNVRIAVAGHVPQPGQPVITTADSLVELVPFLLSGEITPSQLSIVREINTAAVAAFDTAVFSDVLANYNVTTDAVTGVTTVEHLVVDVDGNVVAGPDGTDRVVNIERLQFADQAVVLVAGLNAEPVGQLAIDDTTPAVNQVLTVSAAGITDADNPGTGAITGPISFVWQVERIAGTGVFEDLRVEGANNPATVHGNTFRVTPDLDGLALRVRAVYQDANGTLENVFSAATTPVTGVIVVAPPAPIPEESPTVSPGNGLHLIRSDLQFILDQILISEQHAAGADLLSLLPNSRVPFGIRTVDGSLNNLVVGQTDFGAADQDFPLLVDQQFRNDLDEAPFNGITNTNFATTGPVDGNVVDSDPRIISNLIVDQTITNPSAVQAFLEAGLGTQAVDPVTGALLFNADGTPIILDLDGVVIPRGQTLTIGNTTPDEGLSAPFNAWFTFFGQFFDHGLDLVQKGENGTVFIPLQPDDPLITHGPDGVAGTGDELTDPALQFMLVTRATNTQVLPGVDGILGTADDVHTQNNQTTPFVDQNQTYTSHPAHQVFLRAYELVGGVPVATGRLITNRDLGADGLFGTADDVELGGMSTWGVVKAQARDLLGIELDDFDALNVPLVAVDPYGKFIPGANGFAQLVIDLGPDGLPNTVDDVLVEGNPAAPISPTAVGALRTGHMFLADIAHSANPFSAFGVPLTPDGDAVAGVDDGLGTTYDDELLAEHFMAGDGRVNENIALTAVHHVFHAEHNRLVVHIKDVVLASNDVAFVNQWLRTPITTLPTTQGEIDALQWNGERLFQAARFGTEMQYQHLVFEEFARKVQPQVDVFLTEGQGYDATINPAIVAEFAHAVYRFGHSMLLDTVDRLDPNYVSSEIGLVQAFLNPLAFDANGTLTAEQAAGAIVRGVTRQQGNEIDNHVTEALRNNLLGLPLDLPTVNMTRARDTGVPSLNRARLDFYTATGDAQLKPYASWVDFAMNLRHESAIVNFIAAYGTHVSVTSATTLADKRLAAMELVFGTDQNGDGVVAADRIEFLNGPAATTGVDDIDLWVGGLAERQMPFGGLLGSTFNYVFENQMEKLQNGDRFYYLERTAGLNFLTELENNSFAKLIMANTNATHLPGDVFSTPAFILEANALVQHTGLNEAGLDGIQGTADDVAGADGLFGNSDPQGGSALRPLVMRDDPTTPGVDANYMRYTGEDHVVLGGTAGNDILISSIGDDTLYGDAGNDRLEGGDGVDMIQGGPGDDIITDQGGDDNLQGGDGNDVIHAGNGINLMLGGFGKDFIITGEDESESFGGPGDDFILGVRPNEMVFGNEGDDWLEHGMADGSAGENFDARGLDAIVGNDVFIGQGTIDRMEGEGGDDIMVGNGGPTDRYIGGSGFDWASFKDDPGGVNIDMRFRAFNEAPLGASAASVLARFESTEGLSGSAFSDILRGDDFDAAGISVSGFTGSVLTNLDLIDGLRSFLGSAGVGPDGIPGNADDSFGAGNVILGGNGSDLIEGGGGDDLIDGDSWLNVRISVRQNIDGTGPEIASFDSLTALVPFVTTGVYNPGQLVIVREILLGSGSGFDTVGFSGNAADYTVSINDNGTPLDTSDDIVTVTDVEVGRDGVDRLTGIERLQFADQTMDLVSTGNTAPQGLLTLNDVTPEVGTLMKVSIEGVTDADNPGGSVSGQVVYSWQVDNGDGLFQDIIQIDVAAADQVASGANFRVTADLAGLALRAKAIYKDANGVLETAFSAPTALVLATPVQDTATGEPAISDLSPTQDQGLIVGPGTIDDPDGLTTSIFNFQWQSSSDGVTFTNIAGATNRGFTPTATQVGQQLRVVASFTDDLGGAETRTSAATAVVGVMILGTPGADILVGSVGGDMISSGDGSDTLVGSLGDDTLVGEVGDDLLIGGPGADVMVGGVGNDMYVVTEAGDTVTELAAGGHDTVSTALATYTLGANVEGLFFGGSGDFVGIGNALDNVIAGGAGNDVLVGGAGADTLVGGLGNDAYNVDNVGDLVIEADGGGVDSLVTTLASYTLGGTIENLVFDGGADFTGIGNGLDNALTGNIGNDLLIGNGGADTMTGGLGNDIYVATEVGDLVVEQAGEGHDTVATSLSSYTLGANVEGLFFGGSGNFTGIGNALDNVLGGGAGNDLLIGNGGADTMAGGRGNDMYVVTEAGDLVVELAGEGHDGVTTSLSVYALGANVEDLFFGGAGNFDLAFGNELGNTLVGGAGQDALFGLGGNDYLVGGTGNDIFVFGAGFGQDMIADFTLGQDRLNLENLGIT
ncbi:peroxidase family protein, partial [Pseudomonas sp. GCM10022186]|uniref:peroxidase family protein n=1 Tax=Pseudomonas sp. GCM10022186 TaxID=3252650 RepID=UPI00361320C0